MKRKFKFYYLRVTRIFTQKRNTPESLARGIAIGVFVGLTPTVGIQILPTLLLAILFKGNKILALLFTYVSNPITTIPMYGLEFYLGRLLLPGFEQARFSKIEDMVLNFSFVKLMSVSYESVMVIWAGGLLLAIPGGIISYFVFYRIICFYREQKEKRLQSKQEKNNTLKASPSVQTESEPSTPADRPRFKTTLNTNIDKQ